MVHARMLAAALLVALLVACGQQSSQTSGQSPAAQATTAAEEQHAASAPTPLADAQTTAAPATTTRAGEPVPTAANQGMPLDQLAIKLELVTNKLDRPVYATGAGDRSGRLFVVEKAGIIRILRHGEPDATPFLDITDRVGSRGSEQGLLSVAFHPRFNENKLLFVNYTDQNGDTVISRFQASGERADPSSEKVLLKIDQPYANHNGGLVKFGPDGFLYIGMGDGGSAGDPHGNGQNPKALLGKMLRLDVDGGDPYAIPKDNPWANGGDGSAEVWATGLRNPWRFSFDRATGDLYIADVGQNQIEEVDFQPAGRGTGANYGWNVTEGDQCYNGNCDTARFALPIAEYHHDVGCSVTGGYVYRGAAFPAMQGTYLFGDYCSGRIWGLRQSASGQWQQRELFESGQQISSFGEDEAGELYLTSLRDNGLYRVVAK